MTLRFDLLEQMLLLQRMMSPGDAGIQMQTEESRLMSRYQQPLKRQVTELGITSHELKGLKGLKTLDIGCGKDAKLVKLFRAHDVLAEGIDPMVKDESDILIKREIIPLFPLAKGAIPRKSGLYHLVVAHKNPGIYAAMLYEFSDENTPLATDIDVANAKHIITEALRVMHPQGRFVYSPAVFYIESLMRKELEAAGYELRNEPIKIRKGLFADYLRMFPKEIVDATVENESHRTIIQKRK